MVHSPTVGGLQFNVDMLWELAMFWPLKPCLIAGALLVLQSAWAWIDGLRFLRLIRRRQSAPRVDDAPFATVVIPCKGLDAGFEAKVDGYLDQAYPSYQVVFVVATAEDSAYRRLEARLSKANASGSASSCQNALVVAGLAEGRGEKVNNLLHGVKAANPAAKVLVFADIDATPSRVWLRSLVAPLADPQVTVSTGFRWYLPGEGLVSRLRAAWDTSIATMMGEHDHNFAWGGSMAIRTADFHSLGIAERYWSSTVSDDYAVTRAVSDAKGKIAFVPACLLASQEESSLREFLRWSTRQIIITRVYAVHLWRLGLAAYTFYCAVFVMGIITLASPGIGTIPRLFVAATLLVILLLGAAKGYIRSIVTRELFGTTAGNHDSCYWQLSPLVPWIMLGNFVVAGFKRRIEWRGTEYELVSRDEVRVIRRGSG